VRPAIVEFLARSLGHGPAEVLAPSYFTLAALAAIVATLLVVRAARREGHDVPTVLLALLVGYLAAILSGILVPMLIDLGTQLAAGRFPRLRWAGMLAYGGFAGGLLAAWFVIRRRPSLSVPRFLDLIAAPLGIAIAFVRVGCFVAGCDYGKVTSLPWAVRFPGGSPAFGDHVHGGLVPPGRDASLPVHPTQLYEALLGVVIFLVVSRAGVRRPGGRFVLAAMMYAVGRSLIETLRGDGSRGLFGPLSTSQILSSFVVLACALWLGRAWVRRASLAAAAAVVLLAAPPVARAEEAAGTGWDLGVLVGSTTALNRPAGQVPLQAGVAVNFMYTIAAPLSVGAEADGNFNTVASHSAFLVNAGARFPLSGKLDLVLRGGLGIGRIDFKDASFDDAATFVWRVSGALQYELNPRWSLVIQPVALDVTSGPAIGGAIIGYMFRIGVSYGNRAQTVVTAPPPSTDPAVPMNPY
jgi:prolipoprotein diacylglyceryltransferase